MQKFNVFDAPMEFDSSDPEPYPDSSKVAYWGETAAAEDRFVRVRRGTNVEYYEGEV